MSESATIAVGDELPPLTKTLDRLDLVKYAAGSGDFNPLHYDPDFPQARDIGDNIVHGRLKYAALGRVVSDWLSHRGSSGVSPRRTGAWTAAERPSPAKAE